jgi:hypothetical protein
MKIQELFEEETYIDPEIDNILKEKGYKKLGQGADQAAYLTPDGKTVLKIFGAGDGGSNFGPSHRMFFTWVKYCMKNSNNPFLPKYYDYESFIFEGDRYLQIKQELLKPISSIEYKGIRSLIVYGIQENIKDVRKIRQHITKEEFYGYQEDLAGFDHLIKTLGEKNTQLLLNTLTEIYNIAESKNYDFDDDGTNFMKRSDGTLVIQDPWIIGIDDF